MYSVSDFKKGQTAWVELRSNAARGKNKNELIEEWEIVSVGKCVTAKSKKYNQTIRFEETTANYGGLKQVTRYSIDYILYTTYEDIKDKLDREEILDILRKEFYGVVNNSKYSIEQLRKVKEILCL